MVNIIKNNIFTTQCECIVNTINCVGFMGKGIALEMSMRYPEMEQEYKKRCALKELEIGKLWMYDPADSRKKILNFPTKYDYKFPSKIEYVKMGLRSFVEHYQEYGIKSIAFPMLGTTNGKIPLKQSLALMKNYLDPIKDLHIEIYINDKNSLVRDKDFNIFLDYLSTHQTKKNMRILKLINNDPRIINFVDAISVKISEEQPDGTYKSSSIATKKYIQDVILQINSNSKQNQANIQASLLI